MEEAQLIVEALEEIMFLIKMLGLTVSVFGGVVILRMPRP